MWPELAPTFARNWAETGASFAFAPALPLFLKMEEAGLLASALVRKDGTAVGYALASVSGHHYNPGHIVATSMVLYVCPEQRTTRAALLLMGAIESLAKERGARDMVWTARPHTPAAAMLARRGTLYNLSFQKEL